MTRKRQGHPYPGRSLTPLLTTDDTRSQHHAIVESLSRQVEALSRQLDLERGYHSEFVRSLRQRRVYVLIRWIDALGRRLRYQTSFGGRRRSTVRRAEGAIGAVAPSPADLVSLLDAEPGLREASIVPGSIEAALGHLRSALAAGQAAVAASLTRTILHAYPGIVTADFVVDLTHALRTSDHLDVSSALLREARERWPDHLWIALEVARSVDGDAHPAVARSRWLEVAALVAPETPPDLTSLIRHRLHELEAAVIAAGGEPVRRLDPAVIEDYHEWIARSEDHGPEAYEHWRRTFGESADDPLVTIVMPVHCPDREFLAEALASVLAQWYRKWQLVICDDGSTDGWMNDPALRTQLSDPRIELLRRERNGGIVAATNQAIGAARGAWIAFMDQDDVLAVDALARVVGCSKGDPRLRLIFTDEDALLADGRRAHPYFKPNTVRELLLGQNVISHLAVYETGLVAELGGLRSGLDGSQDWDLNLRAIEIIEDGQIGHVEAIAYHWRQHSSSFSQARSRVSHRAGAHAVADALRRQGLVGTLQPVAHGGYFRPVLRAPAEVPTVSVIIPTRDRPDLIRASLGSMLSITDYPSFEILVVDNGTRDPEARALLADFVCDPRVSVIVKDEPFNFSRLVNEGAQRSASDVLVLFNNDVIVQRSDWLHQLAAHAVRPGVGAVGARLVYPDRTVQHAGVVLGAGGVAGHFPSRSSAEDHGYFGQAILNRDVEAVTGAVLATRRSTYWEAGGFDEEELPIAFNDVDFCLKLTRLGFRNITLASTEFIHLESASRGTDESGSARARIRAEEDVMLRRWGSRGGGLRDRIGNRWLVWSHSSPSRASLRMSGDPRPSPGSAGLDSPELTMAERPAG